MRELDLLERYPQPEKREVGERKIYNRMVASYRNREFFDGKRSCGYGGLLYDGRWEPVARHMCEEYGLNSTSSVLQVMCEKGFLLYEFLKLHPLIRVRGTETSVYARNNAKREIRLGIRLESPNNISFDHKEFDLVIGIGVCYTGSLADAIQRLREIERVGKHAFITLAAYDTEEDYWLMRNWSLLGTLILKKGEWKEVMLFAGYKGDYKFVTAESLRLCASS